jgi:DNA mismatch repair protein MutL
MLTSAVENAYHSLLLTGRHPIAVINIQIDPTLLDVNVHPAKTEIRFLKERRVFAAIQRAVRAALLEEAEMPQWTPTGSTERVPVESKTQSNVEIDPETGEVYGATGKGQSEEEATPAAFPSDNPWMTVTEEEHGSRPPMVTRLWQSHVHNNNDRNERASEQRRNTATTSRVQKQELPEEALMGSEQAEAPMLRSTPLHAHDTEHDAGMTPIERIWAQRVTPTNQAMSVPITPEKQQEQHAPVSPGQSPSAILQQGVLAGESAPQEIASEQDLTTVDPQQSRRLPKLRVVGQVAQSYIVTEGEGGMYLIDQHAAHERILLERMVAAMQARTPLSQLLLTPIQLELSPHEFEGIEEHRAQLEAIGFKLSFDDGRLEVHAVPNVLVKQMNAHSLHELLIDLTSPESLGATETWEERALANVACKAAIKQNYFLTVSEMREMLEQLEQTKAPFSCCHGRPTMVHFGLNALARAFDRR